MRALVISGGGAKGAFGGGIAEYLLRECKKEYDLFIGTSAGSLLIPLLSVGEIEKIKAIFTSVTQSDIFNNCPFLIRKVNGVFKTSINHLGVLKMFLQGKKTLGETENLKKVIFNVLTEEVFNRMLLNKADVIVTVSNLSCNSIEYKSAKECAYHDFCEWIWASSSLIPFMSLVEKNGFEYADGGMGNLVPIHEAVKRGATEIDVILLKSDAAIMQPRTRNALELTARAFDFMLNQIVTDDVTIGKLEGLQAHVKINFYQPKEVITTNALIFDPAQMTAWWAAGFQFAKNYEPDSLKVGVNTPVNELNIKLNK